MEQHENFILYNAQALYLLTEILSEVSLFNASNRFSNVYETNYTSTSSPYPLYPTFLIFQL